MNKTITVASIFATSLCLTIGLNSVIAADKPAHRGRIQIQGPDVEARLGKNALSFPWAQDTVVSKATAIEALDGMVKQLTKTEAADRAAAIISAKKFITNAPASGVDLLSIPKSWGNKDVSAKRIDTEVTTGKAFSD
jgi:hypothetical protein